MLKELTSFKLRPFYTGEETPRIHYIEDWVNSTACGQDRNLLSQTGIEPRFPGCTTHNFITTQTDLPYLLTHSYTQYTNLSYRVLVSLLRLFYVLSIFRHT